MNKKDISAIIDQSDAVGFLAGGKKLSEKEKKIIADSLAGKISKDEADKRLMKTLMEDSGGDR